MIFLPGILGSTLEFGNEVYWPTTNNCLVSKLRPPDNGVPGPPDRTRILVEAGVASCLGAITVPYGYGEFTDFLRATPGYRLFEFSYDWHRDLRQTADELAATIERALQETGSDRVALLPLMDSHDRIAVGIRRVRHHDPFTFPSAPSAVLPDAKLPDQRLLEFLISLHLD